MAAKPELELIDDGFESQFESIYKIFMDAYSIAQGDPAAQQAAVNQFKTGVKTARSVRDAAKANLP
jgi:hypothetical protein